MGQALIETPHRYPDIPACFGPWCSWPAPCGTPRSGVLAAAPVLPGTARTARTGQRQAGSEIRRSAPGHGPGKKKITTAPGRPAGGGGDLGAREARRSWRRAPFGVGQFDEWYAATMSAGMRPRSFTL